MTGTRGSRQAALLLAFRFAVGLSFGDREPLLAGFDSFVEFRSDLFQLLSCADPAFRNVIGHGHGAARRLHPPLLPDRCDRQAIAGLRPATASLQSTQPSAFARGDPAQNLHFFPRETGSLVVSQVASFGGRSQHVDDGIVAIQRRADHGDSSDTQSLGSQIAAPPIDDDSPGDDFDGNPHASLGDVRSKFRILFWRHPGNSVRFRMKSQ